MEAELYKLVSAGGDVFTALIWVAIYKMEKRVTKLEWESKQ